MKNNTFVFRTQAAREFPDPEGIKHYVLLCEAAKIPADVPLDPNPRDQNINRAVYKEVRNSLIGPDTTFHLKNKGITMLADKVCLDQRKFRAEVQFKKGQGIVDGGHTYQVIQDVLTKKECIPDKQFVKIEVLTGVPDHYVSDIAGGLNTSMQVADMSLENLKGHFDWIKRELKGEPYEDRIAYRENATAPESFSHPLISIREVVAWMTMFLPDKNGFPKDDEHPKMAYVQKAKCLKAFQNNLERYKEMCPILKDILQLHDYILYQACEKYNEATPGGRAAALSFMQQKKRGRYRLDFMGQDIDVRMQDGALYPIFGAFRHLVEKRDGKIGWRVGGFDKVKEFCDKNLGNMVKFTKTSSGLRDRNMNAIGKDDIHWGYLYQMVALKLSQMRGAD